MIKSKIDWIKKLSKLKPEDAEDLEFCIQQLQLVKTNGRVSEESITTFYNVLTLLTTMKERHAGYLVSWLKQGYIED